ncbi:hypothetical protein FRC06_005287 [Ceratobasidium sp. 370]|nr:hypothetical protein FRC06_005287 [Ceratobasidium sp. 370]
MLRGDKWHKLKTEVDFEEVVEQGRAYFKYDISKRNSALVKNQADMAKAEKKGTVHVPKVVPEIVDYMVYVRDRNQEQNLKASTKKGKEKKDEPTAGPLKGMASRILELEQTFKARVCLTCKKSCVIVPVQGSLPEHLPLMDAAAKMWAQMAAANPTVSIMSPPHQLVHFMTDKVPEKRGKNQALTSSFDTPQPASQPESHVPRPRPHIPPLARPAHPPPFGYPYHPPHPPPMYRYRYGGYPSMPYGYPVPPPGHPYGASDMLGAPQHVTGQTLLSEWLPLCDQAHNIYRLAELHSKLERYLTQAIEFPTTPGASSFHMAPETAIRLCQYVPADLGL